MSEEPQTVAITVELLRSIKSDEIRTLARRAVSQGWRIKRKGSGHMALYAPDTQHSPIVFSATSDGYQRVAKNFRADLRRRGFRV